LYRYNQNAIPLGAAWLPQNQDPLNASPKFDGTTSNQPNFYRPYQGYANTIAYGFGANSNYHSLQVSANRRFGRDLTGGVAYTWSKAIDNSGSPSLNGYPEDPYRRDLERARSKQDVAHRFVTSFTAEGPKETRLRDFRFSFIANAASAHYYTILAGVDANHDGNATTDRVGTLGRNTLKGDKYVNFDVRQSRVIPFSERVHAEVIAEHSIPLIR